MSHIIITFFEPVIAVFKFWDCGYIWNILPIRLRSNCNWGSTETRQ